MLEKLLLGITFGVIMSPVSCILTQQIGNRNQGSDTSLARGSALDPWLIQIVYFWVYTSSQSLLAAFYTSHASV
jgi:hypothetical protein